MSGHHGGGVMRSEEGKEIPVEDERAGGHWDP